MHRRHCLAAALLLSAAGLAGAQAAYPSKPITMIVPFPPGGLADIVARPVAEAMSRDLGQPVMIENKAGAGGGIGMALVAKAQPTATRCCWRCRRSRCCPRPTWCSAAQQMYALNSLRPIARFTADPTVLAVRADAPWKTVKDFVDDAKRRPGAINYGSSGNYGTMHVPMEILSQNAGIKMTHMPYTGAGPAVVALLGGQIDAVSSGPATVLQHVKAGKLRVLGHWGNGRLGALPDVPSLKDAGYDAEYAQWSGLFIPAGTPEPVAQRLRAAAARGREDPKVKEVIRNAGSPDPVPGHAGVREIRAGRCERMADVVKKIGKVERRLAMSRALSPLVRAVRAAMLLPARSRADLAHPPREDHRALRGGGSADATRASSRSGCRRRWARSSSSTTGPAPAR